MAAISSNGTGGGLWSDTASWAGGIVPVDVDDATIVVGDLITYDLNNVATVVVNTLVVNGVFEPDPTQDTGILLSATLNALVFNAGCELRIGSSTSPHTYLFKCHFTAPAAAQYAMVINDLAIINVYGDSGYYGSFRETTISSDWTTGQDVNVVGDATGWQVGQVMYINQNNPTAATSTSYKTDADFFTISAISAYDSTNNLTTITVTETFVAMSYAGGAVKLCSRSIEFGDPGNANQWVVYDGYNSYTQKIRMAFNQGSTNHFVNFNEVLFFCWDRAVDGGYNFNADNVVFVSNNTGINYGNNHTVYGNVDSNNTGIRYGNNHTVNGNVDSNNTGINYGSNNTVNGNVDSNNTGINYGNNNIVNGNVDSNHYGINGGYSHTVNGNIDSNNTGIRYGNNNTVNGNVDSNHYGINGGYNHTVNGNVDSNNTGINGGYNHTVNGNFAGNTTDIVVASNSTLNSAILEDCTLESINRQPLRVYTNAGNYLPVVSTDAQWQVPPSGLAWIFEAIPNSYCTLDYSNMTMPLAHKGDMYAQATAAAHTITFNIYPLAWAVIDSTKIKITARYLDTATGITRTTVVSPVATFTNDSWQALTVSFTPAQDGIVYFQLEVTGYESGATILIDPQWVLV